ncbi:MAG: FMN-binding protein [Clostridia bacterium]|nr:FMN-binding protein [Clostridia bacterium]
MSNKEKTSNMDIQKVKVNDLKMKEQEMKEQELKENAFTEQVQEVKEKESENFDAIDKIDAGMANLKAMAETKNGDEPKRKLSRSTRDILKCIIVLTVIAVFAGALLGTINYLTYVDADAAIISEIASHYSVSSELVRKDESRIISQDGAKSYIEDCFVVLKAVGSVGDGTPSIGNPIDVDAIIYRAVGSGAYSGTVELLVFVSDDVVTDITVYAQEETKGIGSKALAVSHLSQYIGVNLSDVESFVKSNDGTADSDIEFISGATKTSTAVNNALNAVLYAYNNFGGAR